MNKMKNFIYNKREFNIDIFSDAIRNGMGIMLNEIKNGEEICVAEILRNDNKKVREFISYEENIPLEMIEKFIQVFKEEIPVDFDENE